MKTCALLTTFFLTIACSSETPKSELKYDPSTAVECPKESATDHYLEVPLFYDLAATGAKVDHISGLSPNPHSALLDKEPLYRQQKVKLYYETAKPFDPSKEILFFQAGGPGADHDILHRFNTLAPELADQFNLVSMDHRGVGCSKTLSPGNFPDQSMLMRYAAADIEMIRISLGGKDTPINFFGVSYGTMLAQTYALLYPDHLKRLILQSAFSESDHFSIAQAKFENLALSTIPGQLDRFHAIKAKYPELAKRFILWSVKPMYTYAGRTSTVPKKFDEFEAAIQAGSLKKAEDLTPPDRWVMPPMTRSIACIEIFSTKVLYQDEFQMFPFNFDTCKEFEGQYEYFNYTKNLKSVSARTMILGGLFDLVTPIEAMQEMSRYIPNNFFYMDMHLSHAPEKKECFTSLLTSFLGDQNDRELKKIALTPKCTQPPHGT